MPPLHPPPDSENPPVAAPFAAALKTLCPQGPASPIDVDDEEAPISPALTSAVAAEAHVLKTLLALSRDIRRPRAYVGYSAFLLMGLLYKVRPCVWEGRDLIDLIGTFATWAQPHCITPCAVQAVCCCLEAQAGGFARLLPISEKNPLWECRHFVSACTVDGAAVAEVSPEATQFEQLYGSLGVCVLGTVIDGDCAFDVMTQMLGWPMTFQSRRRLRSEISDYLVERANLPWMRHLMLACSELEHSHVLLCRDGIIDLDDDKPLVDLGAAPAPPAEISPAVAEDIAISDEAESCVPRSDEELKAIAWATNLNDDGLALAALRELPRQVIQEQVLLYREHLSRPAIAAVPIKISMPRMGRGVPVERSLKNVICKAWHGYCIANSIDFSAKRLPQGALKNFVEENVEWKGPLNFFLIPVAQGMARIAFESCHCSNRHRGKASA